MWTSGGNAPATLAAKSPRLTTKTSSATSDAALTTRATSGSPPTRMRAFGRPIRRDGPPASTIAPRIAARNQPRGLSSIRRRRFRPTFITTSLRAAPVARIDVITYSKTEVREEEDVTVGRARELSEGEGVTWVNLL